LALDPSLRRHVEQDAKGVAEAGAAALRSALKRVGGKAKASADAADRAGQRARRSQQAALGAIGRPPASFDEAALDTWLGQLTPEQLRKLGKLVWQARQRQETAAPGLDRVQKRMEAQGVSFEIHGHNVTVNLGHERGRAPAYSGRRSSSHSDWGRQLGRIKDFINGH
jgi:hypothetical protein